MSLKREGGLLAEALTYSVVGAFCDIHRGLGFGFREYLYSLALKLRFSRAQVAKDKGLAGSAPASPLCSCELRTGQSTVPFPV